MGLLISKNIQCFPFEATQNFDEIGGFLLIDPETLMILIILSSRASCCTSVLKIQGLPPMLTILLVMEEEDKAFLS
jgi:hypothetical protein